jgi:hypothetical protein
MLMQITNTIKTTSAAVPKQEVAAMLRVSWSHHDGRILQQSREDDDVLLSLGWSAVESVGAVTSGIAPYRRMLHAPRP